MRGLVNKGAIALSAALVLAGCKDSGLPGKNLPHEEAKHVAFRYPVYENSAASADLIEVAGRKWQVTHEMLRVPSSMLVPVEATGDVSVFALETDGAPYDRLYTTGTNGHYSVVAQAD